MYSVYFDLLSAYGGWAHSGLNWYNVYFDLLSAYGGWAHSGLNWYNVNFDLLSAYGGWVHSGLNWFVFSQRMAGGLTVGFSNSVFLSERDTADRNHAIAYFMREQKCFPRYHQINQSILTL